MIQGSKAEGRAGVGHEGPRQQQDRSKAQARQEGLWQRCDSLGSHGFPLGTSCEGELDPIFHQLFSSAAT